MKKQNAHFKDLLRETIETTKNTSKNNLVQQDANYFQQAILLLEYEKKELQKDVQFFTPDPSQSDFHINATNRVDDIMEQNKKLRLKLEAILKETKKENTEIEHLQREQMQLLRIFHENDEQKMKKLKNLFNVDDERMLSKKLFKERMKLHKKLCHLKVNKVKLLNEIQELTQNDREEDNVPDKAWKSELVVKKSEKVCPDFEVLKGKIAELEDERTGLLNQLQIVLEQSRNEIYERYCNLLKIMTKLELERFNVKHNLNMIPLQQNTENKNNLIRKYSNISNRWNSSECNCINIINSAYSTQEHYEVKLPEVCNIL